MNEFDVVVAGGGSAGCVVASRLSESPDCSVCLVEAGPDYGAYDDGRWPADILNGCELAFSARVGRSDPDDRSQLRARILGGCSSHNACAILPGAPCDYDEWGPGWTADELRPYLDLATETMRTRRFATASSRRSAARCWTRPPSSASRVSPTRPRTRAGVGPFPVNAVGPVRWNAAFAYLDPARSRPNLTILGDRLVDRVRLEGERAIGVVLGDGSRIAARRVVITAGSYGSPAILLRSGIGPENGLPVGENLIDQPGTGVGWAPTEELQRDTRAHAERHPLFMAQVVVKAREQPVRRGHLGHPPLPRHRSSKDELGHPTGSYELSAAVFALKPRSRGRVRLASSDPHAPPVIEHGFLGDAADLEVLADGLALLRRLGASEAMSRYTAGEVRPGLDADPEAYIRETVRGYFHPVGTCALGSVVDASGAVLGHENLYVADASVMPTMPRANTNLSTLAVAEKIAAALSAA